MKSEIKNLGSRARSCRFSSLELSFLKNESSNSLRGSSIKGPLCLVSFVLLPPSSFFVFLPLVS